MPTARSKDAWSPKWWDIALLNVSTVVVPLLFSVECDGTHAVISRAQRAASRSKKKHRHSISQSGATLKIIILTVSRASKLRDTINNHTDEAQARTAMFGLFLFSSSIYVTITHITHHDGFFFCRNHRTHSFCLPEASMDEFVLADAKADSER
jgi:hypothetical protein